MFLEEKKKKGTVFPQQQTQNDFKEKTTNTKRKRTVDSNCKFVFLEPNVFGL